MFHLIAEARRRLYITRVLPLENAAEAHVLLASRQTVGKLVLLP